MSYTIKNYDRESDPHLSNIKYLSKQLNRVSNELEDSIGYCKEYGDVSLIYTKKLERYQNEIEELRCEINDELFDKIKNI
ncbi:hypothetical protein OAB81_02980 [Flavobacteriaceae bacterium]|nr:hypothetical protein [Flavobacteriaceae bacterium]